MVGPTHCKNLDEHGAIANESIFETFKLICYNLSVKDLCKLNNELLIAAKLMIELLNDLQTFAHRHLALSSNILVEHLSFLLLAIELPSNT